MNSSPFRARPVKHSVNGGPNPFYQSTSVSPFRASAAIRDQYQEQRLRVLSESITDCSPVETNSSVKDVMNEKLRAEIHALKYSLSNLETEAEREKLCMDKTIRELENREIETDKRFLFEQHRAQSEEITRLKDDLENLGLINERNLRTLKSENSSLSDQLRDTQSQNRSTCHLLQSHLEDLGTQNETLEKLVAGLQEQVTNNSIEYNQKTQTLTAAEQKIELLEAEIAKVKRTGGNDNTMLLQRELSEQVAKVKTLENNNHKQAAELGHLREITATTHLLKEENHILETKLKMMDDLRTKLGATEIEVAELLREKSAWSSYLGNDENLPLPSDLGRTLAQERAEKKRLQGRIEHLKLELNERDANMKLLQEQFHSAKTKFEDIDTLLDVEKRKRLRVEKQKMLVAKEVEFLREQLKTYDSEEAVMMDGNYDKQKTKRIEDLQAMLDSYKSDIELLVQQQADPSSQEISHKRPHQDDEDERIGELCRRNRQLQDELAEKEKQEDVLQIEIGALRNQLTALSTQSIERPSRILQFRDNPTAREFSIKRTDLDLLKRENAALLAQIEGLELQTKLVPIESLEHLRSECKKLEQVILDREKRITRLKEIFAAKSSEFREAVYSLLGYRLDFQQNGRVKVTSMFADRSDQAFLFDGETSTMQLVPGNSNVFMKSIGNLVRFWVEERKTIPGFLSALTLELFEQTTRGREAGYVNFT
ncbi:Spindle assembly checkpoint component mad1 [Neolecta irregularis DAH-3]|uniref:Spindle assembly checkpoint component MAD1 n=1 Tax=Neolecta irregularis (strain DAH-3) TaxID=1198029 RepID=A0A1U7LQ17_NEOID|nr:Spindle assembly checkpoint component mad1 [Neolecta irregularis DAH-3]|eukprot:OLL24755.1 Spindle assembly checkpoint component mad1 [Neolecta irregularis DAH-3]